MKKVTYIFTALALAYFLGHIIAALGPTSKELAIGALGAALIFLFSYLYTFKK